MAPRVIDHVCQLGPLPADIRVVEVLIRFSRRSHLSPVPVYIVPTVYNK